MTVHQISDANPDIGLLDTSVVIDVDVIDLNRLPGRLAISTITLAELSAGAAVTGDLLEQAKRRDRAQRAEMLFECLPFDSRAARAYGLVCAAVVKAGRKPRARIADLLIASTAISEGMPLYTRNARDLVGLTELLEIKEI